MTRPAAAPTGPAAIAPTIGRVAPACGRDLHLLVVVLRAQAGASADDDVGGRALDGQAVGVGVAVGEAELAADRVEAEAGLEEVAEIQAQAARDLGQREQAENAPGAGLDLENASFGDLDVETAVELGQRERGRRARPAGIDRRLVAPPSIRPGKPSAAIMWPRFCADSAIAMRERLSCAEPVQSPLAVMVMLGECVSAVSMRMPPATGRLSNTAEPKLAVPRRKSSIAMCSAGSEAGATSVSAAVSGRWAADPASGRGRISR